jgi:hypothetical protein
MLDRLTPSAIRMTKEYLDQVTVPLGPLRIEVAALSIHNKSVVGTWTAHR